MACSISGEPFCSLCSNVVVVCHILKDLFEGTGEYIVRENLARKIGDALSTSDVEDPHGVLHGILLDFWGMFSHLCFSCCQWNI